MGSDSSVQLRVALVYDLDGCRLPTGVTRHALAQLERLSRRPEVGLTLVAGRMSEPDGLAYWERLGDLRRRELPVRMRHLLRWWRVAPWPTVETWSGPVDWDPLRHRADHFDDYNGRAFDHRDRWQYANFAV